VGASLLVDSIGEVLEVDDESFEPPPETTQGTARELILGAYKLPDQLLLLLDLKKTLDIGTEVHA
jgi:purine-binding chemotaxis protein CheW